MRFYDDVDDWLKASVRPGTQCIFADRPVATEIAPRSLARAVGAAIYDTAIHPGHHHRVCRTSTAF